MELPVIEEKAVTYRPAEPLEIELVLKNLFSQMTVRDLKICRLVCRDWHDLSTRELEKYVARVKFLPGNQGIQDFDEFMALNQSSTLQPIRFKKFSLSYRSVAACLNKSDWMTDIVSLKLTYLTAQETNRIILPLLHRMKQLKYLAIGICQEPPAQRWKLNLQSPSYEFQSSEDVFFPLKSFKVCGTGSRLMKTESVFLKHCPLLKMFTLCITSSHAPELLMKWLEDFKDPAYPRQLQSFCLKIIDCPKMTVDPITNKSIQSFIKLFPKLQDIQVQLSRSFESPDVIRFLKDIHN